MRRRDGCIQHVIAVLIVAGYGCVQWFVLTHVVPEQNMGLAMRSLGMLDAALGFVLGFYYGASNQSSPRKPGEP
jgi:hypothetical protein